MELCKYTLQQVIEKDVAVIGFYGAPSTEDLVAASKKFPLAPFWDLDRNFGVPQSGLVADDCCHVIRNCVNNAMALSNQLLCVIAAGRERCDASEYVRYTLSANLHVPVIPVAKQVPGAPEQPLLCESRGPLKDRVARIMEAIVSPLSEQERNKAFISNCVATAGFWGTPPHLMSMLDLFPQTTHIFGWTRCVEQNAQGDMALEMTVPENLPTVFFAQKGCPKAVLAKELARKHNGLYVSSHAVITSDQMNKIKAFFKG
ncbi:MAG: hypothetical protein JXR76_28555 [Deltaproteobacteria bacterium]|nr:hypothetical protein [Deltaproteobacteria bacterium]